MSNYKQMIQAEAKRLGFAFCGFSKAEFLEEEAPRLEQWLQENRHGEMLFMEEHFDKRLDPRLLVDGAKTVISLMLNYYTNKEQEASAPKISKYAYGKDYHRVIGKKLKTLLGFIEAEIGEVNGRSFVDIAPVMDKVWAQRSGLGWIGKHTNLITKDYGSWIFLGELILDIELDYDPKFDEDMCGTCTACIDLCPTNALDEYQINSERCISYLNIEHRGDFDNKANDLNGWIYGCDICQNVCPWNNKFSQISDLDLFKPKEEILNWTNEDWNNLDEETFRRIFKGSSVKRTKYIGLKRNITNNVKSS